MGPRDGASKRRGIRGHSDHEHPIVRRSDPRSRSRFRESRLLASSRPGKTRSEEIVGCCRHGIAKRLDACPCGACAPDARLARLLSTGTAPVLFSSEPVQERSRWRSWGEFNPFASAIVRSACWRWRDRIRPRSFSAASAPQLRKKSEISCDERSLPGASPSLQLLLAGGGPLERFGVLRVDKTHSTAFASVGGGATGVVSHDSAREILGLTGAKGIVGADEDVDVVYRRRNTTIDVLGTSLARESSRNRKGSRASREEEPFDVLPFDSLPSSRGVPSIQTFGSFANIHPYIHAVLAAGCFREDGEFQPILSLSTAAAWKVFRRLLLSRLPLARRLSDEFMDNLLSWRHSGFSARLGIDIGAEYRAGLELFVRSMVRVLVPTGTVLIAGRNWVVETPLDPRTGATQLRSGAPHGEDRLGPRARAADADELPQHQRFFMVGGCGRSSHKPARMTSKATCGVTPFSGWRWPLSVRSSTP